MPVEEFDLTKMLPQQKANLEQVRLAFSYARIMITDPHLMKVYEGQPEVMMRAAQRGLMIDAGHLPDQVVRTLGQRGGELTYYRMLNHPWSDRPWLLTHTWEGDNQTLLDDELLGRPVTQKNIDFALNSGMIRNMYLIEPIPDERYFAARITEYLPVQLPRHPALCLMPQPRVTFINSNLEKYIAEVAGRDDMLVPGVASSAINPVLAALILLNTRGVATETFGEPKHKNELARRKGKPFIPGYVRIKSRDYVTAITTKPVRKVPTSLLTDADHGKRRSPIPHLRRGHLRHYKNDGHTTWVRDMLVNTKDEAELSWAERHRIGYKIK